MDAIRDKRLYVYENIVLEYFWHVQNSAEHLLIWLG